MGVRKPAMPLSLMSRIQRAMSYSLPAPIGGWNARDSLAAMKPEEAVILTNFFPTIGSVDLRQGSTSWATGLGNQVNSLLPYNAPISANSKLFAAAGGAVFDVSASGAVGSPAIGSLSNDKWSSTNFATSAGSALLMVNGADGYYVYNGSTWQSVTAISSPISITGVDPTTLSFVGVFAERVWFIQKNSLKTWYLPVDSFGGAASEFDLTPLCRLGGNLVAFGIWTVDGGYGMQDYLCFATNQGEMVIYGGTDPSQSSTFSLVGVYLVGSPVGARCFMKYGGDLVYLGKDGLGPLSQLLASSRVNTQVNLTNKIQGAISSATSQYQANFGWDMVLQPSSNLLILNIPVSAGNQQQYVMNTITGAWCNFTGWPANCWIRYKDQIYYGGNGNVVLAWNGNYDDQGQIITAEGLQAFNYLENPGLKNFLMMRPVIASPGLRSQNMALTVGINIDFDTVGSLDNPTFSRIPYALWDVDKWDIGLWGDTEQIVQKDWEYISGIGYTGAPHIKVGAFDVPLQWVATDLLFKTGAVMG
jgi:hypothetical protein